MRASASDGSAGGALSAHAWAWLASWTWAARRRKSAPADGGLEPPTASRGCIRLCPILTTCLLVYGTLMLPLGAQLADCGCGAGEGATTGEWMLLCRWCWLMPSSPHS